jgi:CubicO group peptidase (beta-lactamase class C family)
MSYSGRGGYAILQLLVEDITGRRFAEYMADTVLGPLGMTRSGFDLERLVDDRGAARLGPAAG